jgi:uncharacterized repeat protein (TIGR03803 family)
MALLPSAADAIAIKNHFIANDSQVPSPVWPRRSKYPNPNPDGANFPVGPSPVDNSSSVGQDSPVKRLPCFARHSPDRLSRVVVGRVALANSLPIPRVSGKSQKDQIQVRGNPMRSPKTSSGVSDGFEVPRFNSKRFHWKTILRETLSLGLIVVPAVAVLTGLLLTASRQAFGRTESVLYSFANNGADGFQPYAALTLGKGGILYGTTDLGGTHGYGTVFELTKHKFETPLFNFNGGGNGGGEYPYFAGCR